MSHQPKNKQVNWIQVLLILLMLQKSFITYARIYSLRISEASMISMAKPSSEWL